MNRLESGEEELQKLHALFTKVQNEESTFTAVLSERNVIDIVEGRRLGITTIEMTGKV